MEVLLIRHAIAVDRSEPIEDSRRPLTSAGKKRFRREVKGLDALGMRVERVFHSPWKRAAQTAELLERIVEEPLRETPLLTKTPGDELLGLIADNPPGSCIALVGHEPWMGELCALLVAGRTEIGERFRFKKGGIAWLEGEPRPGHMSLRALYTPKVLRAVDT